MDGGYKDGQSAGNSINIEANGGHTPRVSGLQIKQTYIKRIIKLNM